MAKTRETAKARTKLRRSKRAPEHSNGVPAVAGGVVDLLARTAVTALSGVRDVGAEVGSVTITAIRGSVRAAGEIPPRRYLFNHIVMARGTWKL